MKVIVILLDTHVVVWLFAGETHRFPGGVRQLIEDSDLAVRADPGNIPLQIVDYWPSRS